MADGNTRRVVIVKGTVVRGIGRVKPDDEIEVDRATAHLLINLGKAVPPAGEASATAGPLSTETAGALVEGDEGDEPGAGEGGADAGDEGA